MPKGTLITIPTTGVNFELQIHKLLKELTGESA